jgi:hypothetical protein
MKTPWAIRLRNTLRFLQNHPEYTLQVGIIPDGQNAFFINSSIAAQFFGLKNRNSFNRDLKQHGFIVDRSANITHQLIPVSRCWVKRIFPFGDFNGDSSIKQTERASNFARRIRNRNDQIPQNCHTLIVPIVPQTFESGNSLKIREKAGMTSELGGRTAPSAVATEIEQTEENWFDSDDESWLDSWIENQY